MVSLLKKNETIMQFIRSRILSAAFFLLVAVNDRQVIIPSHVGSHVNDC